MVLVWIKHIVSDAILNLNNTGRLNIYIFLNKKWRYNYFKFTRTIDKKLCLYTKDLE